MRKLARLRVNGETHEVVVDTQETLLDALRDRLHLTAAKEGCGDGNCGACSVIMDGRVVDSCLVFAIEAEDADVVTVEGVSPDGELHPILEHFWKDGGLECGFCTSGFLMAAKALLDLNPNPTEEEIRKRISGNICRCTGYDKIVRAIVGAAAAQQRQLA
jgi:carbon-monoxide dehydrogenase small subunit